MSAPQLTNSQSRLALPRLTDQVFTDLKIWMGLLGLLVGLVFPPFTLLLGVDASTALRPSFFAATVVAGLILVAVTHRLARIVVGGQLYRLTDRMAFVSEKIEEAALSGDHDSCTPEECRLVVDSTDGFGHAAASFNSLLEAVFSSKQTELTLSRFSSLMSQNLEVDDLADSALRFLVEQAGASAGAFVCFRDGEQSVTASYQITGVEELLLTSSAVRRAERTGALQVIDAPDGLAIDGGLMTVRPRQSVLVPIVYKGATLAVVLLAMVEPVPRDQMRIIELLREPLAVSLNNARTHERFQLMAAIDPLTGSYNRRFGEQRLSEEFARSVRTGDALGLLALDIDHFKRVNDIHGHIAGDRVLKQLAEIIMRNGRHGDILVRTGGEEFLVLLPGADLKDVLRVGERMRAMIGSMIVDVGGKHLTVTVSLGGVAFPECDATSFEQLIAMSDQALYRSKHGGRDQVTLVSASERS